jgi:ROK family
MRIGIDLGGTKIEIIALDDNGATLVRHRVPTPTGDYIGTLNAIADLVLLAEGHIGHRGTRCNLNSDWRPQKFKQRRVDWQAISPRPFSKTRAANPLGK